MTTSPTIQLTENGPILSRIVAGMMNLVSWKISTAELIEFINTCLDLGITTFDHADIYGDYTCEEVFGKALGTESGLRKRMQLVTKCGIKSISPRWPENGVKHYDLTRKHITASVETSLKNLQTEMIDLLLIHRYDPLMDVDEIAEVFFHLKKSGKVRYFGVSNFSPYQVDLLNSRLEDPLVTNQIRFSVLYPEVMFDGTLDQCQMNRTPLMAWSPLGGGEIFTGNSTRVQQLRSVLNEVAAKYENTSLDGVAIAWLLSHPAKVMPVLGSGKIGRLESAVDAALLEISRQDWFKILEASTGQEVI